MRMDDGMTKTFWTVILGIRERQLSNQNPVFLVAAAASEPSANEQGSSPKG
jgi:hypothetical protein